jgi:hypothetical protein
MFDAFMPMEELRFACTEPPLMENETRFTRMAWCESETLKASSRRGRHIAREDSLWSTHEEALRSLGCRVDCEGLGCRYPPQFRVAPATPMMFPRLHSASRAVPVA